MTAPKYPAGTLLPTLKGVEVTVPKGAMVKTIGKPEKAAGRTYKVKVHDVHPGVPAHFPYGFNSEFIRPTSATVMWAGTGGYWAEAKLEDLIVKEG